MEAAEGFSYRFLIDQVLCAKAYLLLKNGLKEVYDITGNPVFEYVKHEKPVLRDNPDIHFNLSHCRRGIMCVIDDMPIGCDIEEIESTFDIDLCHVCFNDNEVAGITSDRAEAEGQGFSSQPNCEAHLPIAGEGSVSDEEKIRLVSELIACAHQVFYPRGRFIFLRSLLTMLNKQRAVPNKEMAEALDMSDLAYRVAVYRMKQNVRHFRERLLKGETLRLDDEHQQMADHINHDFINLYPTLFHIYLECIDSLKTSTAVKHLRQHYLEERGYAVHEPDADRPIRVRISAFWEKLNRWITI